MVDLVAQAIAHSPFDQEPFTEEDRLAVAEFDEWPKHNQPIPLETVLADFGLNLVTGNRWAEHLCPNERD